MLDIVHDYPVDLQEAGGSIERTNNHSMKGSKDSGQPPPYGRGLRFASLGFRNESTAAWQRLDCPLAKSGRKHSDVRFRTVRLK